MEKNSFASRCSLVVSLIACSFAAGAPAAHATGHWSIVDLPDPSNTTAWQAAVNERFNGTLVKNDYYSSTTTPIAECFDSVRSNYLFVYDEAQGFGSSKLKLDFNAKTLFRWIPDNDSPPAKLRAKVTFTILAMCTSYLYENRPQRIRYEANEQASVTVKSTDSTTGLAREDGIKLTGEDPSYPIDYKSKTLEKSVLLEVATNGQTDVWLPALNLLASGEVLGECLTGQGLPQFGASTIEMQIEFLEDNRAVSISRSGATYEWLTNDNGITTTHSDTTYSYMTNIGNSPGHKKRFVNFYPELSGNWATNPLAITSGGYDITWNWGIPDEGVLNKADAEIDLWNDVRRFTLDGTLVHEGPNANDLKWVKGTQDPEDATTATVKYFARDNVDNATAEARHILSIHEPIEVVSHTTQSKTAGPFPYFMEVNGQMKLGAIIAPVPVGQTLSGGNWTSGSSTTNTTGWTFGLQGGLTLDVAKTILGIDLGGASVGASGSYNWSTTIGQSQSTSYDKPTLSGGQGAYIAYKQVYNHHKCEYRLFEANGENKRPGSPLPQPGTLQAPQPSIPWVWQWQKMIGVDYEWVLVDQNLGQVFPEFNTTPLPQLPSTQIAKLEKENNLDT